MPLAFTLMNTSNTITVGTSAGVIHSLYTASKRGWESLQLPKFSEACPLPWWQTWTKHLKCFWNKTLCVHVCTGDTTKQTEQGLPQWERVFIWCYSVHRDRQKASSLSSPTHSSPTPEFCVALTVLEPVWILITEAAWADLFCNTSLWSWVKNTK